LRARVEAAEAEAASHRWHRLSPEEQDALSEVFRRSPMLNPEVVPELEPPPPPRSGCGVNEVFNFRGEPVRRHPGHRWSPRDPHMAEPPIYERGPFTASQRVEMLNGRGPSGTSPHHRHQIPTCRGGIIDELPGPGHPAGNTHTGGSPSRHPGGSFFRMMPGGDGLRGREIRSHWRAKGERLIEVRPGVWIDPGPS
jgi:hypothetical protein